MSSSGEDGTPAEDLEELITDDEEEGEELGEDETPLDEQEDFAAFLGGKGTLSSPNTRPRQASGGIDPVLLLRDFFRVFAPARLDEAEGLVDQAISDASSGPEKTAAEAAGPGTLENAQVGSLTSLFSRLEEQYGPAASGFFTEERFRLCFSSAFFEPLRALYDCSALPPFPLTRPLDNMHKAQLLLPNGSLQGTAVGGQTPSTSAADDDEEEGAGGGAGAALLPAASGLRGAAGSSLSLVASKSLMPHLAPRIGVLHTREKTMRDQAWRSGAISTTHLGYVAKALEAVAEGQVGSSMGMGFGFGLAPGAGAGPLVCLSRWMAERRRVRLLVCVPKERPQVTTSSVKGKPKFLRVRTAVITGRLAGVDACWNLLLTGDCRTAWLPGTRRVKAEEEEKTDGEEAAEEEDEGSAADHSDDDSDSDSDSIVAGCEDEGLASPSPSSKSSLASLSSAAPAASLVRFANRRALTAAGAATPNTPGTTSTTFSRQLVVRGEWLMSITALAAPGGNNSNTNNSNNKAPS